MIVPEPDPTVPLALHRGQVPTDWIDYNGHMTEFRYLQVFSDATDAVLAFIGMDADYLAHGRSIFTVESHVRHLAETKAGSSFLVHSQILGCDAKRLRLHHEMLVGETDGCGISVATGEHMLVHVDTTEGRACPFEPPLAHTLTALAQQHRHLPEPEHAGRPIRKL